MRIILLLSSFFSLLFSFGELFYYKADNFDVINQNNSYKLILKHQRIFNYSKEGFSLFIPKFTKEFAFKVLRYNSTGEINGVLSMDEKFSKILKISPNNLKYYLTDYSLSSARQLNYLLKGYSIPYNKVTSISIEAYNIPLKISSKLDKYLYFKINHINKNNTLKYLIYSFYVVLDKKKVDLYIKNNNLKSVNDFINHIYNISKTINKKPKKIVKKVKKKKKFSYSLHFTRFFYMKDYPFIPIKHKYKIKENCNYELLKKDQEKLLNLSDDINNYASNNFLINKKVLENYTYIINSISNDLLDFKCKPEVIETNKCSKIEYNLSCFKNPQYFNDYIHMAIRNDNIPDIETIIAYGDYKTFNNIGKYYFEKGYLKKSEVFLQKAYALKPDEPIIVHNLAVLYALHSPLYNMNKVIYYLKQSNFKIDYYNLGVFYYLGKGVKESDKKAREYFMKAKNIPMAKENLDIMNKYRVGLK
jgi:hypothetical protein